MILRERLDKLLGDRYIGSTFDYTTATDEMIVLDEEAAALASKLAAVAGVKITVRTSKYSVQSLSALADAINASRTPDQAAGAGQVFAAFNHSKALVTVTVADPDAAKALTAEYASDPRVVVQLHSPADATPEDCVSNFLRKPLARGHSFEQPIQWKHSRSVQHGVQRRLHGWRQVGHHGWALRGRQCYKLSVIARTGVLASR